MCGTAAIGIVSAVAQGVSQLMTSYSESASLEAQAEVYAREEQSAYNQALAYEAEGDTAISNIYRDGDQTEGEIRSTLGASGVSLDSGSALDLVTSNNVTTGIAAAEQAAETRQLVAQAEYDAGTANYMKNSLLAQADDDTERFQLMTGTSMSVGSSVASSFMS
ncbi:MAG: hypothetical protein R3Y11_02395 [Pseudomonadota bacterium]